MTKMQLTGLIVSIVAFVSVLTWLSAIITIPVTTGSISASTRTAGYTQQSILEILARGALDFFGTFIRALIPISCSAPGGTP